MAVNNKEVDIIVAGGGTAGCLLAARLAKADPALEILIVEAGGHTQNDPNIVNPALMPATIPPEAGRAAYYISKPSEHLGGRALPIPTGGCLGGGSSINVMMYSRPLRIDFEDINIPGWSLDELLPLFKKYEHFHFEGDGIDANIHGYNGELHVSMGPYEFKAFQNSWIKACEESGVKIVKDGQNFVEGNALQRQPKWVHPQTGRRQDVPHQFVYPLLDSGNTKLEVQADSKVQRVLFDGTRAVGIEYLPAGATELVTVRARKLVVVSAGAMGSPLILQRSGIGSSEKLAKLGITSVAEVPGVGATYQDHVAIFCPHSIKPNTTATLEQLFSSPDAVGKAFKEQEVSPQTSILGSNGCDFGGKLRPTAEEVAAIGGEFEELWDRDFKDRPSKPLVAVAPFIGFLGDRTGLPPGDYASPSAWLLYPNSKGSTHISGPSVADPPDFDSGFLAHPADVAGLVWAYKKLRSVVVKLDHYDKPYGPAEPGFADGSRAADFRDPMGTLADGGYTKEDDAVIEKWIRESTQSLRHSSGTCPMKPLAQGGTVDKDLNVYGVTGLKVADLSILPNNVGANTYSTALMVGEKAAVIIASELGIKL